MTDQVRKTGILAMLIMAGFALTVSRSYIDAQSKGKPPRPAVCNNDAICQAEEYMTSLPPGSQPCLDCLPSYAPLVIRDVPQIISYGNIYHPFAQLKAFQFVCDGYTLLGDGNRLGRYIDAWGSSAAGGTSGRTALLADVDNCGHREIVMASNDVTSSTRKTVLRNPKIHLFKNGSAGEPSWTSPPLGEGTSSVYFIAAGDVDNDGTAESPDNELIVARGWGNGSRSMIGVYDLTDGNFNLLTSWTFPDYVLSVEVGDADNDGLNEIVFAAFTYRAPVVREYDAVTGAWNDLPADPCDILRPHTDALFIDYARIRDSDNAIRADGEKDNELVCGGNNNRLMIWKYDGAAFRLKFVSEDLGGFTEGVEAGDFDGDGFNEAVVGTRFFGQIRIFQYGPPEPPGTQGTYRQVFQGYAGRDDITQISAGDSDGDGIDELCATTIDVALIEIRVLEIVGGFASGSLNITWVHPYGHGGVIK